MRKFLLSLGVAAGALCYSAAASAAIETYSFTAMVTGGSSNAYATEPSVVTLLPIVVGGGTVTVGEVISGSFSYDTAGVELASAPSSNSYYRALKSFNFTLQSGGLSYSYDPLNPASSSSVVIGNGNPDIQGGDFFAIQVNTADGAGIQIDLINSNGALYNSTVLPQTLSLSDFDKVSFGYTSVDTNAETINTITSTVTSLTAISPVPEPNTLAMLAAGIALVGFTAKRRKA